MKQLQTGHRFYFLLDIVRVFVVADFFSVFILFPAYHAQTESFR